MNEDEQIRLYLARKGQGPINNTSIEVCADMGDLDGPSDCRTTQHDFEAQPLEVMPEADIASSKPLSTERPESARSAPNATPMNGQSGRSSLTEHVIPDSQSSKSRLWKENTRSMGPEDMV